MDRSALERPFDASLVKSRKCAFGRVSYVEGVEYIRRLNEAFELNWSFEVLEHRVEGAEVLVVGRLTAGGIVKTAFGGSQVTKARETGEIVSIVDDFKAAATDALKKACSLFGVGLHLYSNGTGPAEPARRTAARSRRTGGNGENGRGRPSGNDGNGRNRGNHNGVSGGNGGNAQNPDRITQRQLSAVWAIARKAGYSSDEIRARAAEMFGGAGPEFLSKAQASELIGNLSNELGDAAVGGA